MRFVVIFDEVTPEECIRLLRPNLRCKGTDYAPPNGKPVPEASIVEGCGGRVEYLPPGRWAVHDGTDSTGSLNAFGV